MSLRTKITLVLLGVIGVFATANYVVQQHVFFERFENLETGLAEADVRRVQAALEEELQDVVDLTHGWANWDALFHFTADRDPAFVLGNLSPARLEKQKIDLLFIVGPPSDDISARGPDEAGVITDLPGYLPVLWSRVDLGSESGSNDLALFPREALSPGHPLASAQNPDTKHAGILLTEHRPLIVASQPIRRSSGDGEGRGTLILGRFIDADLGATLSAQTHVNFEVFQADGRHPLPPSVEQRLAAITSSPQPIVEVGSDGFLDAFGTFNDIRQRPDLILHARIPADVLGTGQTALHSGMLSSITGGAILLFVLLALLRRIVLAPLMKLTRHAEWIGSQDDFRAKLSMERDDEFGVLSREFDRMMEQLDDARAAYVETARSAGMSQVATGILHNVGNVLSSVNVATDLVAQRLQELSIDDLQRLTRIVEENADDLATFVREDKRGKHLQPFLSALTEQLAGQRAAALEEVKSLAQGVEHICELVKSQQSYSTTKDLREPTDLSKVIDQAVHIADKAMFHDKALVITRQFEDLPDVEIDRHRVLEILINLVTNARQAMTNSPERELTLRLFRDGDWVKIQVSDTGIGLDTDQITQVFNPGYTTKKTGMGYGLHSSANAATEFQGKLYAESEGPGHGATFILEIPFASRPTQPQLQA